MEIDIANLDIPLLGKCVKGRSLTQDHAPEPGRVFPALGLAKQLPNIFCEYFRSRSGRNLGETDAFYVPYVVLGDHSFKYQRLNKTACPVELSNAYCWSFSLDFDRKNPDGSKRPHHSKADATSGIAEIRALVPELRNAWIVASSKNGYRAIFVLSRYLTLVEWSSLAESFYNRYGEGENLMITPSLKLDRLKDWTRLMRVPSGIRNGNKNSDDPCIVLQVNESVPRLDVGEFDLTLVKTAHTHVNRAWKSTFSPSTPAPTREWLSQKFSHVPQTHLTDSEASVSNRDNFLRDMTYRMRCQDESAPLEELYWRVLPAADSLTAKSTSRTDYVQKAWDMLVRAHIKVIGQRVEDPEQVEDDKVVMESPEDVRKVMAEKGKELDAITKGLHLFNTPPGSSKSNMLLARMKTTFFGGIWASATRAHRDEMRAKFKEPSEIRLSNEEILEQVMGARFAEAKVKLLLEKYAITLVAAKKAAFYGRGFEGTDGVTFDDTGTPTPLFVWLFSKGNITSSEFKESRKVRNENDTALTKAKYIFCTHDGLLPMVHSLRNKTGTDAKSLAERDRRIQKVRAQVDSLRSYGVQGMDELYKAEAALAKLMERDTDPLAGRWVFVDEVRRSLLLSTDIVSATTTMTLMGGKHVVTSYEPWEKNETNLLIKFLQKHAKESAVVLCSADGGFEQAAQFNEVLLDSVMKLNVCVEDNDLSVMLTSLGSGLYDPKSEINRGDAERLKDLFLNDRNTYVSEYQKILDYTPRGAAIRLARELAPPHAKLIASGKRRLAIRREFLEWEEGDSLCDLNMVNVVGSNMYVNSILISFITHPTPQQIGAEMLLGGITEEQAIDLITTDNCNQVASRNTGFRGVEYVLAHWEANGGHQALNNAHYLLLDNKLKGSVKSLVIRTKHTYHAGSDFSDAPELVQRFYGIHA